MACAAQPRAFNLIHSIPFHSIHRAHVIHRHLSLERATETDACVRARASERARERAREFISFESNRWDLCRRSDSIDVDGVGIRTTRDWHSCRRACVRQREYRTWRID